MKCREFLGLIGGAAVTFSLAAQTQQPGRMRRVGLLLPAAANDVAYQARVEAFEQARALSEYKRAAEIYVNIENCWNFVIKMPTNPLGSETQSGL